MKQTASEAYRQQLANRVAKAAKLFKTGESAKGYALIKDMTGDDLIIGAEVLAEKAEIERDVLKKVDAIASRHGGWKKGSETIQAVLARAAKVHDDEAIDLLADPVLDTVIFA